MAATEDRKRRLAPDRSAATLEAITRASSELSLFAEMSEGAVVVDREARITWINEKYRRLLGIEREADALDKAIEDIIPESRLRDVVDSGRPVLLDLMRFGKQTFVVCRLPLHDERGDLIGAVGFVFFDRLAYMKPILSKFQRLEKALEKTSAELTKARRVRHSLSSFIGHSQAVRDLKTRARRIAAREGPVLILGETGVGKELLAQGVHQASYRAASPFVAVNVAAVPEALMESEFFGVAPGAFTGAERRPRPGKFEVADGGTLFLDEIGDIPQSIQAKFLRVLEEGEIEQLGSNQVKRIDVRIIAATSANLEAKVQDGSFRQDLFYRLAVLPLEVPPLRERPEDIEALAERILDEMPAEAGHGAWQLTPDALTALGRHGWRGNVRELRNVLERATLDAPSEVLDVEVVSRALPTVRRTGGPTLQLSEPKSLADTLEEVERKTIAQALSEAKGDKVEAARLLGISRSSLYAKLKEREGHN